MVFIHFHRFPTVSPTGAPVRAVRHWSLSPSSLGECPLSADRAAVELDDAYEITATVVDSHMLEWWLRGFGDAVSAVRRSRGI